VVLRPTGEAAGTSGTVADWTKTVHLRPNLAASLEAPLLSGEYGWDFETGTLEEWQREDDPSNPAFASQPTCGSNVAVGRISPPGYDPQIDTNIGGDFWNTGFQNGYSGKYWIGTFEARRDGTVVPFTTQGDGKTGKLRSPQFRIDTDYITFLLGGGSTHLERIELQVKGPTMGYRGGLGVDYLSSSPPPANDGEWTVLYAASPRESSEEMRRVYWDVRDLRGRTARFRIVDDSAGGWGHINADDFRGTNVLVPGLGRFEETIRLPGGGTGSRRLTYERVEPMVRPLWGYADLHNHMMANLGYGGNSLTWGDPISTTVEQLYQGCRGSHVKNSNYETYHNLSPTAGAVLDIIEKRGGVHLYQGHKITGLGSLLHQSMHRDWVYRAYQGGLRLMVMRALNFRAMEAVLTWQYGDTRPATQSNTVNTRDIVAIQRQLDRVRDFVAANPWAEIAYTPADARAIIGRNHLAIVLGAESPDMADAELRNQYPSDWPTRLVQDLYGRGIRDITIVHATDNAVAGAALVSDMYNTANHFQNGTVFQVEAAPAESGIGFRLSNNVALGFVRDIVDICLTVGAVLGTRPPSALTTMCDASPCGARGRYPGCNNSMCFSGDCLQGSMQNYPPGGHRNVRGFAARGEEVISLLMDKGMMIDMDHMSEKTRRRLYEIAVAPRRGYTAENYPKYPIISSHANMREQQVAGEEFADSPFDISIVADTGGVIGPITNGEGLARDGITQRVWSNLTPLGKGSSVDWLARYYYALEKMGGRGVAMGTDMNSPSSHILSRREYPAVPQFTFPSLMPEQWIAPWPNFHNTLRHQAVRYENHGGDTSCVVERGNNDLDADRAKDINWYPVTEYTQILDIAWRPALKRYLPPEGYRDRPGVSFFHEPVEIIAHSGCTGDDFNVDGFVHYGLLPDLLQDVANQMTDWREDLAPLFSSAEDYIKAWEKACQLSATGRCETFRP
jgi:microsomal dipeptidase-like Zn-dependent dipeptidase